MSENRDRLYELYEKVKIFTDLFSLEESTDNSIILFCKVNENIKVAYFEESSVNVLEWVIWEHSQGYRFDLKYIEKNLKSSEVKTLPALKEKLVEIHAPYKFYTFNENDSGNDCYELSHRIDGYWTIGHWDHGKLESVECYEYERDACTVFFAYLLKETEDWNEWMKKPLEERYPGGRNRRK